MPRSLNNLSRRRFFRLTWFVGRGWGSGGGRSFTVRVLKGGGGAGEDLDRDDGDVSLNGFSDFLQLKC